MKKIWIITGFAAMIIAMVSCNKVRRSPGRAYMPDMSYSRAYETYATTEGLQKEGAHYTALPVKGTIARGDMLDIYTYANDSAGYAQSGGFKNPLNVDSIDMKNPKDYTSSIAGSATGPNWTVTVLCTRTATVLLHRNRLHS